MPTQASRQKSLRPEEIAYAVLRARIAQEHWKMRPLSERIALVTRAAKKMLARRHEAMTLAHDEMGKVEAEAISTRRSDRSTP